ncbi:MAG: cytochrome c-type biogenesis protein CcmH [Chloroflexi bacterium]|nr:cytochrome c-type biogenesis protein CcmH [Chloroflexota bacterium]
MKAKVLGIALALAMFLSLTTQAYAVTSKDVERELMCQCGCTMVVDVCDCETANQIREKIALMIGEGQDKGQIVAYFVGQYGEKMLSAPTKKGFNLVAWIVPFAAVLVGGTGLFFILRAWVRKGHGQEEAEPVAVEPVTAEVTAEYKHRVADELKRFKQEGER